MRLPGPSPLLLVALVACSSATPPPPEAPPVGPGNYEDTGPLAACGFKATTQCTLAAIDLSACERSTLAQLPSTGIFHFQDRYARPDGSLGGFGIGSLRLREDATGGPTLQHLPLAERQVGPDSFAFTTQADGSGVSFQLAGCAAQDAKSFTGCFQQCEQGPNGLQVRARGTFRAERLEAPAEPEARGLALVGEARAVREDGGGMPNDVHVVGDWAYVVSQGAGLFTFDLSDRAHPRLVKHEYLPEDAGWQSIAAKGPALYVASHRTGVRVYDVTNPADPVFVRALPGTPLFVRAVQVDGDRLVATCPGSLPGIRVFDVKDALAPVPLPGFSHPGLTPGRNYGPHDLGLFEGRAPNLAPTGRQRARRAAPAASPRRAGAATLRPPPLPRMECPCAAPASPSSRPSSVPPASPAPSPRWPATSDVARCRAASTGPPSTAATSSAPSSSWSGSATARGSGAWAARPCPCA